MKLVFKKRSNFWDVVKVPRQPKFWVLRQTTIEDYFPKKKVIEDVFECAPVATLKVAYKPRNLFEESEDEEWDDNKEFYERYRELEMEELGFIKENGSPDYCSYEEWLKLGSELFKKKRSNVMEI